MAKTPRPAKSTTRPSGKAEGTPDPDEMDPAQQALFREVEEDLRAEQLQKLWKRFGPYIIGAAVLVVGIVAGFQGWTAWQASVRADEAQRYFNAVGPDAAGDAHDAGLQSLAQEGSTGYAALARLTRANGLADAGETALAINAYDAIAADGTVPGPVRTFAGVMAAMLAMDIEDEATVRGRLAPLADDDSPWRFLARELIGLMDMRAGNTAAARDVFSDLTGEREAPPGVRSRATEYLTMLGGAGPAGAGED